MINLSTWDEDNRQNIRYYTDRILEYGIDARSLDWSSQESQFLRFSILAQVGRLDDMTVLDIGCGMGDLFGWLSRSGIKTKYTGIDITPKMIEIATQRYPDAHFELMDIINTKENYLGSYDVIFASGIFTYRKTDPVNFMKKMVKKMYSLCKISVAFNSLSSWALKKSNNEFYADPVEILDFCRTLTPMILLRHDYHPRDFTVYLYKRDKL